jgi:hypothetical protein
MIRTMISTKDFVLSVSVVCEAVRSGEWRMSFSRARQDKEGESWSETGGLHSLGRSCVPQFTTVIGIIDQF